MLPNNLLVGFIDKFNMYDPNRHLYSYKKTKKSAKYTNRLYTVSLLCGNSYRINQND